MNGDSPRLKQPGMVLRPRYTLAFFAGAIANVFGMAASGSVGIFAIITLPMVSGIVGAFSVLICAVLGYFLNLPTLNRLWVRGFGPAAVVVAVGLGLYALGINDSQLVPGSDPEEPAYQLGRTYWPGFFMFVFGMMHIPTPARSFTAEKP